MLTEAAALLIPPKTSCEPGFQVELLVGSGLWICRYRRQSSEVALKAGDLTKDLFREQLHPSSLSPPPLFSAEQHPYVPPWSLSPHSFLKKWNKLRFLGWQIMPQSTVPQFLEVGSHQEPASHCILSFCPSMNRQPMITECISKIKSTKQMQMNSPRKEQGESGKQKRSS